MFLKKRFLCRILVAFAIWLPTSLLAQTKPDGTNAKTSVVRVPFVGCPSNGRGGPNPAPKRAGKEVVLDAGAARRLAYYESESSSSSWGVLAHVAGIVLERMDRRVQVLPCHLTQ